ncbi:MAG: Planctomycete cytochrome [Verrucomicrobiales bacterium]|nr:Planctomycete cytochrome [Verrucomicrobiales bacterium]
MKPVLSAGPLSLAALLLLLPPSLPAGAGQKPLTAEDRAWWSFQPVADPAPPEVGNAAWAQSPVDRFIFAALDQAGLTPAMEAPKATLIRRLSFDLLGLPPSRQEVEDFVSDTSPDAWPKLVDRLLDSPHYGERQARLWLDLVRYAESDGYKADAYRPDAWRYRDYVIEAFNADKPYDRFIREQLAGDELFPDDPQALVATGYLRHWIYEYNNRDAVGQWSVILNDITDTTADVFMGLGLQCARCHDHKFDPLLQKDYYRLQAYFAAVEPRGGTVILPASERAARQAKQAAWEAATAEVRQRIEELRAPALAKARKTAMDLFPPEIQSLLDSPEESRTPWQRQIAGLAGEQVLYEYGQADSKIKGEDRQKLVTLRKELAAFDSLKPEPWPTASTMGDVGPVAPELKIPRREADGDIAPGPPTLLSPAPSEVKPLPRSTGRRSALAAWLTEPSNPLTARVMVNRVWQQHFGQGLCATTSDFGRLGGAPSHPALLDWLAHRFVAEGWSLKKLHRVILTSRAWRQSHVSPCAEKAKLIDPGNRLLWRWTTRRLEAEQIRDTVLSATGELDMAAGGPSVDSGKPRRAIYTKVLRNTRDPLLDVFDAPQNITSIAGRDTTTTATQSLFLANSRFMSDRAQAMAGDLMAKLKDDGDRVDAAWWRTAGRAPTTDEREESLAFLSSQTSGGPEQPSSDSETLVTESMPQRNGKAVVLAPGSAQERLTAEMPALPAGDFTVESVVLLKSVQENDSLRGIAGQWSGDKSQPGWVLGITGRQSQRKAQMPALLLCGPGVDGAMVYEPVFSDFQMELDRSYSLAAAVHPASAAGAGAVTFYMKDLANEDLPVQVSTVPHPVAHFSSAGDGALMIGAGADSSQDLWDGLIDEVRVSRGILGGTDLIHQHPEATDRTMAWWSFEPASGPLADSISGHTSLRLLSAAAAGAAPGVPKEQALADFCQAMLSFSALLYVD